MVRDLAVGGEWMLASVEEKWGRKRRYLSLPWWLWTCSPSTELAGGICLVVEFNGSMTGTRKGRGSATGHDSLKRGYF